MEVAAVPVGSVSASVGEPVASALEMVTLDASEEVASGSSTAASSAAVSDVVESVVGVDSGASGSADATAGAAMVNIAADIPSEAMIRRWVDIFRNVLLDKVTPSFDEVNLTI